MCRIHAFYRDPDTMKYKSNETLYNNANIIRIDNFIIKLIRNYFAAAACNESNRIINRGTKLQDEFFMSVIKSKYIPPEAFIYLDKNGYIQDTNNVPILYHIKRKSHQRNIQYPANLTYGDTRVGWAYDPSISVRNQHEDYKYDSNKYCWLARRNSSTAVWKI